MIPIFRNFRKLEKNSQMHSSSSISKEVKELQEEVNWLKEILGKQEMLSFRSELENQESQKTIEFLQKKALAAHQTIDSMQRTINGLHESLKGKGEHSKERKTSSDGQELAPIQRKAMELETQRKKERGSSHSMKSQENQTKEGAIGGSGTKRGVSEEESRRSFQTKAKETQALALCFYKRELRLRVRNNKLKREVEETRTEVEKNARMLEESRQKTNELVLRKERVERGLEKALKTIETLTEKLKDSIKENGSLRKMLQIQRGSSNEKKRTKKTRTQMHGKHSGIRATKQEKSGGQEETPERRKTRVYYWFKRIRIAFLEVVLVFFEKYQTQIN